MDDFTVADCPIPGYFSVGFELPFYVMLPRKTKEDRKVMLNLNVYRNLQHFVLNDIKTRFEPIRISNKNGRTWDSAVITYHVCKKGNRRFDTMNIISVVDKFFCDWLVYNKWLPDDNCDCIIHDSIIGEKGQEKDLIMAFVLFKGDEL